MDMHERLRCANCHRWSDALLVWAAGDCCPHCNQAMQAMSLAKEAMSPVKLRPAEPSRAEIEPPPFGANAERADPDRQAPGGRGRRALVR
jgi:hypothetical protein